MVRVFEVASGLKLIMEKIFTCGININIKGDRLGALVTTWGCSSSGLTIMYLGLLLEAKAI